MKNIIYKSLIALFLVISLCSLTACGHGGGGGGVPAPQAISEITAARLSVKNVVTNISKIIGYIPSSSRASQNNISVPEELQKLAYGKEINQLIPSKSGNEFRKGLGPNNEEEWIQNSKWLIGTDQDSSNRLAIGTNEKYKKDTKYNVALYEGKEGSGSILTKIVTKPTEKVAVAVSYLNDGNGNQSTFVFVVNQKGEFEGKIFAGIKDEVTYNSDGSSAEVYGDKEQMTYSNNDSIEVVKMDGTSVSSTSPEIEGFKYALNALKFVGQLRTGEDGQSDSPIIYENQLNLLPPSLYNLSTGQYLDEYMKYSTLEAFINDGSIINKFKPEDLEDYEDVRIGDYKGTLNYYSGVTATPTLRLALSVIENDSTKIITKIAGQDNGLYIVSISYLTINNKEYTVAVAGQMIRDSEGIFIDAKMFEGKRTDVNYVTTTDAIGTAKVEYKSETEIPVTITVNGKTLTYNAASNN